MCDKRDLFCFICGLYTDKVHKVSLSNNPNVIELYEEYFGRCLLRDKWYIPQICCTTCYSMLRSWKCPSTSNRAYGLPFLEPTIWFPRQVHTGNKCYFCLTKIAGYHFKVRHTIKYAKVDDVILPEMRCKGDEIPVPYLTSSDQDNSTTTDNVIQTVSEYLPPNEQRTERHYVTKQEFEDLVRDLELPKNKIELLGSRMKQWNFLDDDVKITFIRKEPNQLFESCFSIDDKEENLAYCNNVNGLFHNLGISHDPTEWRLFIDGSTKSKIK